MSKSPIFIAFRKKFSAKDFARTARTPAIFMICGACSREDPSPKLLPATTKSPLFMREAKVSSASSSTCFANSFKSERRWNNLPGAMWSVLILSPNLNAFPLLRHVFYPHKKLQL